MDTYRFGGHYVGDAEVYRQPDEVEAHRAADPIARWEAFMAEEGWIQEPDRVAVWDEATEEVASAERFAESSPWPEPASALEAVFTS